LESTWSNFVVEVPAPHAIKPFASLLSTEGFGRRIRHISFADCALHADACVELLLTVARTMPDSRFLVVTTAERERSLGGHPSNVAVETDLAFEEMRSRLERARAVALPVRENSYSGATTVLLQAMALAKPVVVTRTAAIATGYGLEDGDNVRLVPPGDGASFGKALTEVLQDDAHARALGAAARRTVERDLSWEGYVERLAALLHAAAGSARRDRGNQGE